MSDRLILVIILVMVAGCTNTDPVINQNGASAPHNSTVRTVVRSGAGPGLLLSSWVGQDALMVLDEEDCLRNWQAENRAINAPVGQQATWNNPHTGHEGTIAVVSDFYASNGAYCRNFQQSLTLNGQRQQGLIKACQQADGRWQSIDR